ncbi:MAG: cytochrome c oxidase subunit II [Bacteroidota bacterium]
MDASEKMALGLSGGMLALFFGALIYASAILEIEVPTCITDVEPFTEQKLIELDEKEYELQMIARMWTFQPSEITLPVGSTVHLYVTSPDIVHGFKVEGKNVNLMAVPNTVNYIKVTFGEEGVYHFSCHEFCGIAHHTMAGRFRITDDVDEPVAMAGGDR